MSSRGLLMAVHMATLVAGAVEPLPPLEVDAGVDCCCCIAPPLPAPSLPSAAETAITVVNCCCCCCWWPCPAVARTPLPPFSLPNNKTTIKELLNSP